MKPVDMSPEAVSRRLIRLSQLRELCLGLAGPRRRPLSSFGKLLPMEEEERSDEPTMLKETPPPYRSGHESK